ncbi:MAG TPA: hypothetical protein VN253_17785 [Kofleriaceae bacterium]|nr:hypothetical protein [Kofleriaceae bacterium]
MRRLLTILALAALGGCITPSIPIPPPDPAKMTFSVMVTGDSSTARFTYPPDVNYVDTIVFVFNRDRGVGVIEAAKPDGSVGPTAPVSAAVGDQIVVSFERQDQTVSTCIRLRDGAQNPNDYCGP